VLAPAYANIIIIINIHNGIPKTVGIDILYIILCYYLLSVDNNLLQVDNNLLPVDNNLLQVDH